MVSTPRRSMTRLPMGSLRTAALLAGVLYVITFAASIPAAAYFLLPVVDDPQYILGAGQDIRVTTGALLDVINALACIGTAVMLYPVVRRQSQLLALGFLATRIVEAAVIMAGVMALLAVVTLRQDMADDLGADARSLLAVGAALVAVRDRNYWLSDKDEIIWELYGRLAGAYEAMWSSDEGDFKDVTPEELVDRMTAGASLSHRYAFLGRELLGLIHSDRSWPPSTGGVVSFFHERRVARCVPREQALLRRRSCWQRNGGHQQAASSRPATE